MALTREVEIRLERVGLVAYFNANKAAWVAACQDAYDYTKKAFNGDPVRADDIAKAFRSFSEIHPGLRKKLDEKKLSQKYWIDFFDNLVIDKSWDSLKK